MADLSAAPTDNPQAQHLTTLDQLLIPFHEAMKPLDRHRIGAEAEKFGVDAVTGAPLPYEGERSVCTVLEALIERHGAEVHARRGESHADYTEHVSAVLRQRPQVTCPSPLTMSPG